MATNNRANEVAVRRALETMLNALSSSDTFSYFEFLVIARQLSFRFESPDELAKLKIQFERANDKLSKSEFLLMLEIRGYQVMNNIRMQYNLTKLG